MSARPHLFLICCAILLTASEAWAQDVPATRIITIVNADSVAGEIVDGQRLRRLIGNVHLRQDTTDLRARRAIQFLDRDEIVFEGDVEISDPGDTLRAARVSYDSFRRIGRARGNVRLADAEAVLYSDSLVFFRTESRALFEAPVRLVERDGGATLTSRRGTYFTDRKEAFFEQDVRLEDSTSVLTSEAGRYGTADKRAEFAGDVRLTHDNSTRLRSDTLTHQRDTRISEARGDVAVLRFAQSSDEATSGEVAMPDTTRRTLLFGGYVYHDEDARYSRVERGRQPGNPLVARLATDSLGVTDTLLVQSAVFEAFQPDSLNGAALPPGASLQRIFGVGDVRLSGERIAAVADSVVVDRLEFEEDLQRPSEDDVWLFVDPRAWLNSRGSAVFTQVSGDTMRLTSRDEALDSLRVLGRAFTTRPDSVVERENQIRGRQLVALFRDDSLRAIRVWPNAESIFFRADSLDQLEGAVRVSSDSLSFTFRGEDLQRISGHQGVEGTYYDAAIIPEPFRLEGPPYAPGDRPLRSELLAGRPPLADPFARPPPPPDVSPPDAQVPQVPLEDASEAPAGDITVLPDVADSPPDAPATDIDEFAPERNRALEREGAVDPTGRVPIP
jgi:lipopolysaccharide export system protein LptA